MTLPAFLPLLDPPAFAIPPRRTPPRHVALERMPPEAIPRPPRRWGFSLLRHLYVQVLLGVALGILVGWLRPAAGAELKPLADLFIALVKMIIAPIIFCSVVHGLASMSDLRQLGRVGGKTLLYFEVVSTLALALGLLVVNLWQPGAGPPMVMAARGAAVARESVEKAHTLGIVPFLQNIVPGTFFEAFAKGDLLQVLLVSVLTAFGLSALGEKRAVALAAIESASQVFFRIMRLIVALAPLGAFGAMAFTVGTQGLEALGRLASLIGCFYVTSLLFVFGVLGIIARVAGFSIWRFVVWIREEIFLVLGTSSSETALPGMLRRLRELGCRESTVGLVIPTGYSFNLDGTNIYMTIAAVFLAQATHTPLDLRHQLALLVVAMLSSKGASGVTGAGFVTLAATLAAVPGIPIESLGLVVGIDRFMSECRALTNLVGNGVATVVISRLEGEVTGGELRMRLGTGSAPAGGETGVSQAGAPR